MQEKYHKIKTVWQRDPETNLRTLIEGQFAIPEFEYLKDNQWIFEEKVDGTNIRVDWDMERVTFGGRTDDSQFPALLVNKLQELFPVDKFKALYPDIPMCLYGEGYGLKIKKGAGYIPDGVSFILFDVFIVELWLERPNVEDIAEKLEIKTVPIIGQGTLQEGVDLVRGGFDSVLRKTPPEGLVMRPVIELKTRRGERIITKLKLRDFG